MLFHHTGNSERLKLIEYLLSPRNVSQDCPGSLSSQNNKKPGKLIIKRYLFGQVMIFTISVIFHWL